MATSRKLIAALTASLVGISRTLEQMKEDEEFKNEQRRRDAADVRADEYLGIQKEYLRDSQAAREEAERERKRIEANTANQRVVDDAALISDAQNTGPVAVSPSERIAPTGPGQRPSETIPLATGGGNINLDLQQIFSKFRPGGDTPDVQSLAREADTRRSFLGSVREAGIGQDITRENRIEAGTRGERLQTERERALMQRSINPPSSGGGAAEPKLPSGIEGVAESYAEQGLNSQEIVGRLIRDYRDVNPQVLLGVAIDAFRKSITFRTSAGQDRRDYMEDMGDQAANPQQKEWDEAAAALRQRGQDPEQVLGPRP